jgi:hypothetical protein
MMMRDGVHFPKDRSVVDATHKGAPPKDKKQHKPKG